MTRYESCVGARIILSLKRPNSDLGRIFIPGYRFSYDILYVDPIQLHHAFLQKILNFTRSVIFAISRTHRRRYQVFDGLKFSPAHSCTEYRLLMANSSEISPHLRVLMKLSIYFYVSRLKNKFKKSIKMGSKITGKVFFRF